VAPILSLSCLGQPQVVTAAGEAVRFRTRKHLALLVRLAAEPGRKLTRYYLTDLLWPEAPERLASHSLAQGLSVIRARVGRSQVLVQRATVALADGVVDVDVHHLDQCDVEIRGAFLDGFDLPGARPFEDWKDEWRAKLQPRIRDCLVKQMDAGRRLGDFATVERHAHVLHELDPLSEDAIRGMIEARAWVGDRSNALKAYATYEARLVDELGAKPSPELQRMADLLREGRSGGSPRPRSVSEPCARAERRFEPETVIGREREFSVLYDAWLAARRRAPSIVVLTGDPGLGKTTLANAFVSTCQLEGAVVARAQAYDAERELPFGVLAELVRQLSIQRAVGGAEPEALSELSRLTPEVRTQFPGVPLPVEWAAEIVPLRLADAFLKAVTAAAEESPVVLVVDDVHAADNASAAILHLVARKLPATRLMVILAARSTELRTSGAAAALTSDTVIEALRPLDLEPLPDETAGRLVERVRAAAARGADGELPLDRILRAGRGNPLALELLTREWVAHGPESLLRDLEALNTQPAAALGIPRAIKAVFERQVARLDRRTRRVLDLAAVLGRRLADLSLYEAVDSTPAEAADALARLRDEGLVREVHGDIEFRNELIRAQAYYAVPAPGRRHLHRRIGEMLTPGVDGARHAYKLEVCWHLFRGDQIDKAVPLAIEGAEEALRLGAPAEAESIMMVLLNRHADRIPTSQVRFTLAKALLGQSKAEAAGPILDVLLSSGSLSPIEFAETARMQSTAEYLMNRETGVRQYRAAARALEAAERTQDPVLQARAAFEYARSGLECGDMRRIAVAHQRVAELKGRGYDGLSIVSYAEAYCLYYNGDVQRAAEALTIAIAQLQSESDLCDLSLAYNGYGLCMTALCRFQEARQAYSKSLELSRRLGDDSRTSLTLSNLSVTERFSGQTNSSVSLAEESVRLGVRSLSQPHIVSSYNSLVESYMLIGDRTRALEALEQARAWAKYSRSWRTHIELLCTSVAVALMTANVTLALELIPSAEHLARGRELAVPDPGGFESFRIFNTAHTDGPEAAFKMASEMKQRFEGRHLLYYLDAVSVIAWLERSSTGCCSPATRRELCLFDTWNAPGKKVLSQLQGWFED